MLSWPGAAGREGTWELVVPSLKILPTRQQEALGALLSSTGSDDAGPQQAPTFGFLMVAWDLPAGKKGRQVR